MERRLPGVGIPMHAPHPRRAFLRRTTVYSFGLAVAPLVTRAQAPKSPGDKLVVGVMGLGRGFDHVKALQQIANVEAQAWQKDRTAPIAAAQMNFLLERDPQ